MSTEFPPHDVLGSVQAATVVCPQVATAARAYIEYLDMRCHTEDVVSPALAHLWQAPALTGAPLIILESRTGSPWLRLVEDPEAGTAHPFRRLGWMALELAVADTDSLAARLSNSPFRIVGGPGPLDMSPLIRATQVVGPAGEVLYLTQIDGDVPPFQLPRARCPVDRLFIPVLSASQRTRSAHFYQQLANTKALCVETRISALNQALGYPIDQKHPVAVIQLPQKTLLEIDQLPTPEPLHAAPGHLPPGIAVVSFAGSRPGAGALLRGPDSERVEIVGRG